MIRALLLVAFLSGCSSAPEKAASIEDYCRAVAQESDRYVRARAEDTTAGEMRATIRTTLFRQYPAKEIQKMQDVVDMVYAGLSFWEIEKRCVTERKAGTWYKT